MTSQKKINIFYFNGVNVAKHWHVAGEVFAISDCLVTPVFSIYFSLLCNILGSYISRLSVSMLVHMQLTMTINIFCPPICHINNNCA